MIEVDGQKNASETISLSQIITAFAHLLKVGELVWTQFSWRSWNWRRCFKVLFCFSVSTSSGRAGSHSETSGLLFFFHAHADICVSTGAQCPIYYITTYGNHRGNLGTEISENVDKAVHCIVEFFNRKDCILGFITQTLLHLLHLVVSVFSCVFSALFSCSYQIVSTRWTAQHVVCGFWRWASFANLHFPTTPTYEIQNPLHVSCISLI